MLTIGLIGPLEVRDEQGLAPLPRSRKTRMLLGYLAASARPQRRDRLCELFWDTPDDPRAALRWSLTKLRAVLDRPGAAIVRADRETVALDLRPEQVDYLSIREILKPGVEAASTGALEAFVTSCRGAFLADVDMPRNPELSSWLAGMREETHRLRTAALSSLVDRHATNPERALPHARDLVSLDPYVESSWARLIERLAALGRRREVEDQYQAARKALAEAGGATHLLDRARSGGRVPSPAPEAARPPRDASAAPRQEIRFCRAEDGVRLAYASAGEGPPLVKTANWLNHLEYDWETPVWDHLLRDLARRYRLLRYDSRGSGLSDWNVEDVSLDLWVSDLKTVVDAAGYERFPLFGVSQGCAISIAFAARYPERVSHLVLYAGYPVGVYRLNDQAAIERRRAMTTLMRLGWGQDNPAFRQMFTSQFIPEATREQADAFNELQRRTASPEFAAKHHDASAEIDVRPLLAQVSAPTLVMHPVGDALAPIDAARGMAARIPGAKFVPLPGSNHLILEHEPATARFHEEIRLFLGR